METGPHTDPGRLDFEGPWHTLPFLDSKYRDQELIDTIQLISRDIQYQVFHLPPDDESDKQQLNEYSFISVGGNDYEESDTKMFILTIEDDKHGQLRVYDTKELDLHIARTGDLTFPEELMEWIRDDMGAQLQLGSATPNQAELERFEDIVKSWEQFEADQSKQD